MDWIWPMLVAPFVGSFVGVLIRRLPAGRTIGLSRSACERCGTPLEARDLVPLLSFAILHGRCRRCSGRIAPFHWHVEIAAFLIPLSAGIAGLHGAVLWAVCGAGWSLLALAWIDAETMLLPDALTLPLIPAGLLEAAWLEPDRLTDRVIATIVGFTALWGLAWFYRRVRGRDGLGEGDAKLLAALGAWVGLEGLPAILLGSASTGLLWALWLHTRGRVLTTATVMPFGPFLSLAGWVVLLLGYPPS